METKFMRTLTIATLFLVAGLTQPSDAQSKSSDLPLKILTAVFPRWRTATDVDLTWEEHNITGPMRNRGFSVAVTPMCGRLVTSMRPLTKECKEPLFRIDVDVDARGTPTAISINGQSTGRADLLKMRLLVQSYPAWSDDEVEIQLQKRNAKHSTKTGLPSTHIAKTLGPIFGPIKVLKSYFMFRQAEDMPATELLWHIRFETKAGAVSEQRLSPSMVTSSL